MKPSLQTFVLRLAALALAASALAAAACPCAVGQHTPKVVYVSCCGDEVQEQITAPITCGNHPSGVAKGTLVLNPTGCETIPDFATVHISGTCEHGSEVGKDVSVEILKKSAGDSVPGSTGVDFTPSSEDLSPTVRSSPSRAVRAVRSSAAAALPPGMPRWSVSLGGAASGSPAGRLSLSAARMFGPRRDASMLRLMEGPSSGLDVVWSKAARREGSGGYMVSWFEDYCVADILAPDCFVRVSSPSSFPFSVSFYSPSSLEPELDSRGNYVLRPGASPFLVCEIGPGAAPSNSVRVVERRPGLADAVVDFSRSQSAGGTVYSVSRGGGLHVAECSVSTLPYGLRRVERRVSGPGGSESFHVVDYADASGVEKPVRIAEYGPSGPTNVETRTYCGPGAAFPGGLASRAEPSGLVTEWEYDSAGRVVRETVRAPGRPVRVRTMSYNPIGVRPHAPAGVASIADDDCTEYVGLPRDETESVGGVAVSRTLRFAALDARSHRIVEEVRLRDPLAAGAADAWEDPANPRSYSDYMPKNSCRSCSERLSLGVAADGTVDERDYVSGIYEPGQGGSAGVFTPDPENKKYFRTVATRRPAGALSGGPAQVPGRTVREVTVEVRSSRLVVLRETHVCTGPGESDFERIAWTATTRDHLGNPVLEVSSDGSRVEREYAGERLLAETAADGSRTTYSYDALGRVVSETKSWNGQRPSTTTSYVRDPEDRVLSRTVSSGNLSETETTEYDAFGRTTLAVAADGVATKYLYETDAVAGLETRTAIRGFGTPCAVTNETVSYSDGRTKETRLNGFLKRTYSYGTDADGCEWTKTSEGRLGADSPRWRTAKTDPLGRTVEETTPGFGAAIVSSNRYDAAGRLAATSTYASPTPASILRASASLRETNGQSCPIRSAIYLYDSLGERTATVEDIDFDGVVDLVGPDRVVSNSTQYVKLGSDWWRARNDGSAALSRTSCVRERMTGLGGADGLVSESVSIDIRGNETRALVCRDRAAMAETRIVSVPGSEIPETTISVCGLVATNVTSTGVATLYGYDALGRETSATDGRGNTTTTAYDQYGRVASTTDGAGNATTYGYDAIGRRVSATDPMGNTVFTAYDAEGRVVSQRGATYPVDYAYNDYGEKISMTTYRSESLSNGDVTRWLRDEATGLVTNKVYADGKGPSYAYTPDGRLATRTWARGVVTAYAYDSSGALTNTVYSDGTPTVSMAYDRVGNLVNATTAGVVTNLYAYDLYGHCTNEWQNDFNLTRYYDALGRSTGYAINGTRQTTIAYDSLGRIATMSVPSGQSNNPNNRTIEQFSWAYLPGSDLKASLQYPNGLTASWQYDANNQLIQVCNATPTNVISQFDYTYDAAGRRVSIAKSGSAFGDLSGSIDSYTYNARSELISARRTKNGQPIPGFSEDFDYDPIGNRRSSSTYNERGEAQTSTYQANNLNQYTSRTTPGYAAVRGEAAPEATVTVNENPTWRLGEYFFGSDTFDNSSSGGFAELETYAVLASPTNGPDEVSAVTSQVYLAQSSDTFAYDDDGNQTLITTKTGLWRVTYNGENRPVRWVRDSDNTTLAMAYDHMGRRREKNAQRFFYDGYQQIANFHSPTPTQNSNYYIWDCTEPVATRPLAWHYVDSVSYYTHDGNKNVSEVVASIGSLAAAYEYAPFGVVITQRGEFAAVNPWRFSCEFEDDEFGCVYYMFRNYEPTVGRWLERDPVEDNANLYLYDCHGGIDWDLLGLFVCVVEASQVANQQAAVELASRRLNANLIESEVTAAKGALAAIEDDRYEFLRSKGKIRFNDEQVSCSKYDLLTLIERERKTNWSVLAQDLDSIISSAESKLVGMDKNYDVCAILLHGTRDWFYPEDRVVVNGQKLPQKRSIETVKRRLDRHKQNLIVASCYQSYDIVNDGPDVDSKKEVIRVIPPKHAIKKIGESICAFSFWTSGVSWRYEGQSDEIPRNGADEN